MRLKNTFEDYYVNLIFLEKWHIHFVMEIFITMEFLLSQKNAYSIRVVIHFHVDIKYLKLLKYYLINFTSKEK